MAQPSWSASWRAPCAISCSGFGGRPMKIMPPLCSLTSMVPSSSRIRCVSDQRKWDQRFLEMAYLVGGWSKDPSTKTGAVIVDTQKRVVSVGYNGFPAPVADDARLHCRELTYEIIVHAEVNALIFAQRTVVGCTLYTSPFMSCSRCAAMMI